MATISPLHRDTGTAVGHGPGQEIVAVILSDGSVLQVPDSPRHRPATRGTLAFTDGRISGANWTLWWERRVFASQSASG